MGGVGGATGSGGLVSFTVVATGARALTFAVRRLEPARASSFAGLDGCFATSFAFALAFTDVFDRGTAPT